MHRFTTSIRRRRAFLRNAVCNREGIGIFEYTERNLWVWGPALALAPLFMILAIPFVRPFKWSHLVWTWLVPLFTLTGVWDGIVSCMRTYTPEELLLMARDAGDGYEWRAGRVRAFGACRVTYLVGWPEGNSDGQI